MKHSEEHLDTIFAEVRNMPLEVDLASVEAMIAVFPPSPPPSFDWGSLFSLNNIIMSITTTSLLAGAIYLFTSSADAKTATQQYYMDEPSSEVEITQTEVTPPSQAEVSIEAVAENPIPPVPDEAHVEPEPIPDPIEPIEPMVASIPPVNVTPDELPELQEQELDKPQRVLSTESFGSIVSYGSWDVIITQATEHKVWAEGDDRAIEKLNVEVNEGELGIGISGGDCNTNNKWSSYGSGKVTVYVETPAFDALSLIGSGDVYFEGFDSFPELSIALIGSGDIDSGKGFNAQTLEVFLDGSGDIILRGQGQSAHIHLEGSGDIDMLEYKAAEVEAFLDGSGDIMAYASSSANVSLEGSGDIDIDGSPKDVQIKEEGSGDVVIH